MMKRKVKDGPQGPPQVVSYIRFSTKVQGEATKSSTPRQRRRAERWCEKHGLSISPLRFTDLGVTGSTGKHLEGALGLFLEALEEGVRIKPGDILLVEAIDRLSRLERLDAMELISRIVRAGVTIVTSEDGVEYSLESLNKTKGLLQKLAGKIEAARDYSEQLSERLSEAWALKHEDAIDGIPTRKRCPAWLNWDQCAGHYVENEHAATVREIYRLARPHLDEDRVERPGMSSHSIARVFNEANTAAKDRGESVRWPLFGRGLNIRGLRGDEDEDTRAEIERGNERARMRLSRGWTSGAITRILNKKTVYGEVQLLKKIEGAYTPWQRVIMYPEVVPSGEYDVVRRVREARRTVYADKSEDRVNNLFSHRAKCIHCGASLVFHDTKRRSKNHCYMICRARKEGGLCKTGPSWRASDFENHVLDGLKWAGTIYDKLALKGIRETLDGQVVRLRDEISRMERDVSRITKRMALEDMPESAIVALGQEHSELSGTLERVRIRLVEQERKERDRRDAVEARRAALATLGDVDNLRKSPDGRRRLRDAVRACTEIIEVDSHSVTIRLRIGESIRSMIIPGSTVARAENGRFRKVPSSPRIAWSLVGQEPVEPSDE